MLAIFRICEKLNSDENFLDALCEFDFASKISFGLKLLSSEAIDLTSRSVVTQPRLCSSMILDISGLGQMAMASLACMNSKNLLGSAYFMLKESSLSI